LSKPWSDSHDQVAVLTNNIANVATFVAKMEIIVATAAKTDAKIGNIVANLTTIIDSHGKK